MQNENNYIENFGIETYEEYSELIEKIYETTAGCGLSTKKEYSEEISNEPKTDKGIDK